MFKKVILLGGAIWLLPLMLLAQISYLPGWPQSVHGPGTSTTAIADIDDDGTEELIYGDYSFLGQNDWWLYIKTPTGTDKPGWPVNFAGCANSPVLADLDDDGKLEIIKPCGGLKVWNSDGTLRWQYSNPPGTTLGNASLADLDNDGALEIVATCTSGGAVFVFDVQGVVKPGWPVVLTRPAGWTPPPMYKSASIGDIDGDDVKEIIIGVDEGTNVDPSQVHCFKPNGSECPGFPVGISKFQYRSKAILADINNDVFLEVLIGKEALELSIIMHDGSYYPGYPLPYGARGLSLGDLDNDGDLDLLSPGGHWPLVIRGFDIPEGSLLPNYPFSDPSGQFEFGMAGAAANICNIHDASGKEVVAGAGTNAIVPDGKLFAFDNTGQIVSGFPSTLLSQRWLSTTCAINDLDGDGNTDICCGSSNDTGSIPAASTVYCWDTGYPYNLDNVDWAMDGFDLGHTGRWRRLYHISKSISSLAVTGCTNTNPCYLPPDGSLIAVYVTAVREHVGATPTGQDVRYSRTLGCANYEGPVIDHGDGTYTRMLRAPTADCTTEVHAWVNEFKLQDYQQIIFTSGCVVPPPAFSLLNPEDGDLQQPLNVTLEWPVVGTVPNQAVSYDLYFGTTPDPPAYQSGLATTYFDIHYLAPGTTYYWRVEARNACGTTSSPVWSFTTVCPVPEPFANLCPADGATDLPLDVELAWEASTQAESYQVSLGLDPAVLTLIAETTTPSYELHGLSAHTTYYWQATAQNACGETPGPVWSFTTGEEECRHCRPVSPP